MAVHAAHAGFVYAAITAMEEAQGVTITYGSDDVFEAPKLTIVKPPSDECPNLVNEPGD